MLSTGALSQFAACRQSDSHPDLRKILKNKVLHDYLYLYLAITVDTLFMGPGIFLRKTADTSVIRQKVRTKGYGAPQAGKKAINGSWEAGRSSKVFSAMLNLPGNITWQVWIEKGWQASRLIENCCQKSGVPISNNPGRAWPRIWGIFHVKSPLRCGR